ncbi:hypothetical protein ACWC5I_04220 [Kitasatospora sp. NPDC001574]
MIGPEIRSHPAVPPEPALAAGEVLVATDVTAHAGARVPCPAAPLVAAGLERAGVRVRTAPVTLLPEGVTSPFRLVATAPATGPVAKRPALACGALVAPDPRAWGAAWNAVESWSRLARARAVLLAGPRSFCGARRFAGRGSTAVLVGYAGHEEAAGILGEAPESTLLVRNPDDVVALDRPGAAGLACLTRSTPAVDEAGEVVHELRERFVSLHAPAPEHVCHATTDRRLALRTVAAKADLVLVVGPRNSSDPARLVDVCRRGGTAAHLIEDAAGIRPTWLESATRIGLTAGASAPPALVDDVIAALRGLGPVTVIERSATVETVRPVPPSAVNVR